MSSEDLRTAQRGWGGAETPASLSVVMCFHDLRSDKSHLPLGGIEDFAQTWGLLDSYSSKELSRVDPRPP